MIVVRRLYVLLVSAISLNAVAWALISFLRGLLTPGVESAKTAVAFQIAVILVGVPLFIVHWLWAQRLAARDPDERMSTLRRLYFFGMLAGFVGPLAVSGFNLLYLALRQTLDVTASFYPSYPVETLPAGLVYYGIAMGVLVLFLAYMQFFLRRDMRRQLDAETPQQATVRRLYVFAGSAVGMALIAGAVILLLRWGMYQIGSPPVDGEVTLRYVALELARLPVGVVLWLVYWSWAQRLFGGGGEMETAATARKFYLYTAVFAGTVTVVASATTILATLFAAGLDVSFNGDIRQPLAPLFVLGGVWAYHALQLDRDARLTGERPQQAGIRRLYHYLVAGVGLLALLIGIGGAIGVLFFVLDGEPFAADLRQELAWFAAAIIAGLLVWLLPWRRVQTAVAQGGAQGQTGRQSLVRKIYLYLYIFLATLTVLGTAVFIVSQLVELALAARDTQHLLRDLGMALSFGLLGVGIWVYHGLLLRRDGRAADRMHQAELAAVRVVLLPGAQPEMMERLRQTLRQKLPGVDLQLVPSQTATGPGAAALAGADVIISPVAVAPHNGQAALADAVALSPARKLLLPVCTADCIWLGVTERDIETLGKRAVQAIEQIAAGEKVDPGRGLGAGTLVAIVVAGLILLGVLASLLVTLISEFFLQ